MMASIKLPHSENYHTTPDLTGAASVQSDKTPMVSTAEIGLRTEKTAKNKFGWQIVNRIPYDEPCVLYVGGDGTDDDRKANGNAKIIEQDILAPMGMKIPVYSVRYNFAKSSAGNSRGIAFMKNRAEPLHDGKARRKEFAEDAKSDDFSPQYLDTLYKNVIEPRISITHGKGKLSVDEACRRVRMITFVAHCHGGYVMLELEKRMQAQMKKLGYDLNARKQILSQMLTVAHSPACALGVAKSQLISFMSAEDVTWPKSSANRNNNNFFNNYLYERKREHKMHMAATQDGNAERMTQTRPFEFKPCYFPPQQGNMFLIREKRQRGEKDDLFQIDEGEHGDLRYDYDGKTPAGQMVTYIAGNIIKNSIKNSLRQKEGFIPLPQLDALILGGIPEADAVIKKVFPEMIENGKRLRREVCQYALSKTRKDSIIR